MNRKIKKLGQIYTPKNLVSDILDFSNYKGYQILKKHVIDNSCGNGAILKEVIKRYIEEYKKAFGNLVGIENDFETYIHGIEVDKNEYQQCIINLNQEIFKVGISNIVWDIINEDAMVVAKFDGKMDYVLANPPYVRIQNLEEKLKKIREFKFCKKGMVDLYIVFYEIGFNMLNKHGKLCYITPNSFYSSDAASNFRKFLMESKNLRIIADLGQYKPFKTSTYTTICFFDKSQRYESFEYYKYNNLGIAEFKEQLNLQEVFNDGKIILAQKQDQDFLKEIQNYIPLKGNIIEVKNGFATLADSIFITENDDIKNSIKVIKASTGKWYNCFFPYDEEGKVIPFEMFESKTQKFLLSKKKLLKKRSLQKKTLWYEFGRTQAIKDVYKKKFSINTTIKDIDSIKINEVDSGCGVYSGLYILGNCINLKKIKKLLLNEEFINYVKILGKCKSGGYYTYSSRDLKKYLIYKMEKKDE